MAHLVSIVMYHYVRPLKSSRYPEIKGLERDLFKEQIAYIKKHYNVIGAKELMDRIEHGTPLPPNALILSFDDGYIDHFLHVYPLLKEQGLSALFFPPAKSILEHQVLDVNKIHFVLASVANKGKLLEEIHTMLDQNRHLYDLESNEHYWQRLGRANRFDSAEVVFIKRMLQRELPMPLRQKIVDQLFCRHVTSDEVAFAQELYMNMDQIAHLQRDGMYIGNHGFNHHWLNAIAQEEQAQEIELSLRFLDRLGADTDRWIMCYPYGAYNASLLSLLHKYGCVAGLTTQVGISNLQHDNPLTLPRLDTNDLPKDACAKPNLWTQQAISA